MRKVMIAGNWKMHKTVPEAVALVEGLIKEAGDADGVDVVVAPPFTALTAVFQCLQATPFALAAQNVFYEPRGAFTGEISLEMLRDAGCRYVIVGHSERRQYFGETDEIVNRKIHAVLEGGLSVIFCLGESLDEREQGETFSVVERQLRAGLQGCGAGEMERVIIAYEPIWAIGTGKTATPQQAQEVHAHIRTWTSEAMGPKTGEAVRILYGGSVKPSNAAELMAQPDIDGALVGGASLTVASFQGIIAASSGTPR